MSAIASTATTAPAVKSIRDARIAVLRFLDPRQLARAGSGISSRSRTNSPVRSLSRSSTGGHLVAHVCERLRDGRAHGPALHAERIGDLVVRETEVVVGDDDEALPLREEREQPADIEALDQRRELVLRRALADPLLTAGAEHPAARLAERDPVEPALEIAVVGRWMPQTLLEGVVQPIERAIAIERRGHEGPIDLWERAVIEIAPPLPADVGHT